MKLGGRGRTVALLSYCFIVFTAVIFFYGKSAKALDAHLVINEVYYDTIGTDSEEEWIELYNPLDIEVNITGYKIISSGSSTEFILPEDQRIQAKGFFVIARDEAGFAKLYGFNPNIDGLTISLANNGDDIFILDDEGSKIDSVFWEKSGPNEEKFSAGASTNHSIEREPLGIDTDDCSKDFVERKNPTPGREFVKPVYSDSIIISEILPHPDNGTENEFIELFNNGSLEVDLSGWYLDDAVAGGLFEIPAGTKILPQAYLAFYKNETSISLNDSGDTVKLLAPDEEIKHSVQYVTSFKGQSYSLINNQLVWTLSPTFGMLNILKLPVEEVGGDTPPLMPISSAREEPLGEKVTLEGIVTAPPGVLSSQYFYIQDTNSGIQIYCYGKYFPPLKSGDRIRVRGELAEISGEKRLKIVSADDISFLSFENPPAPVPISISEVNEANEGRYVKIIGKVTRTSGNTFYVSDDKNQEVRVVIRASTEIVKPKMRKGDTVEVCGIVSQYRDYYRILPTKQEDVKILTSQEELANTGVSVLIYFIPASVYYAAICYKKRTRNL